MHDAYSWDKNPQKNAVRRVSRFFFYLHLTHDQFSLTPYPIRIVYKRDAQCTKFTKSIITRHVVSYYLYHPCLCTGCTTQIWEKPIYYLGRVYFRSFTVQIHLSFKPELLYLYIYILFHLFLLFCFVTTNYEAIRLQIFTLRLERTHTHPNGLISGFFQFRRPTPE